MRVRDYQGGFAAYPDCEDGTVLFGPGLELEPGFSGSELEFVAYEGEGSWAWWEAEPLEDVVD